MDFFLNKFILTDKDAGGLSFKSMVLTILNDCGVPYNCDCPDDCLLIENHIEGKTIYTKKQIDNSFAALLEYVKFLETRIEALEP